MTDITPEALVEKLKGALEFYADGEWSDGYPGGVKVRHPDGVVGLDFGETARHALKELEAAAVKWAARDAELVEALRSEWISYKDYGSGIVWCQNCEAEWPDETSGAEHEHHNEGCPLLAVNRLSGAQK